MDKTHCFICKIKLPSDQLWEKTYDCTKHEGDLVPLCETCWTDFDYENCQLCQQKYPEKKQEIQPQQQQQQYKQQQEEEKDQEEVKENLFTAVLILPGFSIILNPEPVLTNLSSIINICAYSSVQLIASSQDNNYKILQTGGIQNPQESIMMQIIQPSSICQQLSIGFDGNTWNMIASNYPFELLTPRYCHTSKKISDSIVIVMGGLLGLNNYLTSCESIDLQNNKVSEIVPFNKSRSQCSSCVANGYLYAFGGFNGIEQQENSIERISVRSLDKWELINLENQEKFLQMTGCVMINSLLNNNEIFIFGGSDGKQSSSNIYSFNSSTNSIKILYKMNLKRTYGAVKNEKYENSEQFCIIGFDEDGNISLEKFNLKDKCIFQQEIEFEGNIQQMCQMFTKDSFVLLN